ncbi:MAG: hypothetical protein C0412_00065 [Flavobacterium sp.]|nr:hypothetical protein [Flavobacterium sp.]
MSSSNELTLMPMHSVVNNASIGNYTPKFFELDQFELSNVEFNSLFFEEQNVEEAIIRGGYSFAYLRENKLRTIHASDANGDFIFDSAFCTRLGIKIQTKNIFKTSKYLSRIFRPVRYGGFFKDFTYLCNNSPELQNKSTDGISLISLNLAKSLGWKEAEVGKSAQFTMFCSAGLVKGHCVISATIGYNAIIWEHNIKNEVKFIHDFTYVAIEPVKISDSVRMDIQSLLNLWGLFGDEQYFSWAKSGIDKYKSDLVSGKLTEMLDNFEDISPREYEKESWTLKKAVWHKIDYRVFPGLMRLGWQMFRKSILHYAERNGTPVFRIPVPSAYRGYIRCDIRNHDDNGGFSSSVESGSVYLDKHGNVWIAKENADEYLSILGGADMDDSVVIIPIEDGKAVIYRNPNQYGEYLIVNFEHDPEIIITDVNRVIGIVPQKKCKEESVGARNPLNTNPLISKFLSERIIENAYIDFSQTNLLRTYSKISNNSANIGVVANAEMIRSSIGINKPAIQKKLSKLFPWNLERVIDSVVKDGVNCAEDLFAVESMYQHIIDSGVELPLTLIKRLPESKSKNAIAAQKHRLDQLFEAVKFLIAQSDKEVLGEGSASRHNRIPGIIDKCQIPLIEIGISNITNPMNELSVSLLKNYNKQIAILLDRTKGLPMEERENIRSKEIENIQKRFLVELNHYTQDEKAEIVKAIAYHIYKGESFVHDSILWISDKDNLFGTADVMISMLANIEIAAHVKKNGNVKRFFEQNENICDVKMIRVWSKEKVSALNFNKCSELLIAANQVLIGESILNLGEEIKIEEGTYQIKNISQAISKKNNSPLYNSLAVYLS